MNIIDAVITVIVGLLGLATPTEKFLKKIMERVKKMGQKENERVEAAEKELDAALAAKHAADKDGTQESDEQYNMKKIGEDEKLLVEAQLSTLLNGVKITGTISERTVRVYGVKGQGKLIEITKIELV